MVPNCQSNSCNLNTRKSMPKIAGFITVYLLPVCRVLSTTVFVIKLWEKSNAMKKNSFTQKSLRKNVFSMLLTWFPLLGACFWILCRNHNFCCVSTVILTKPCFRCCWKQISLEKSDSGSFQCCWKQISLEKSDSGSIGNKAWI